MIITLRGTNGSGKSTIVRTVMSEYQSRTNIMADGRRNPLGYVCSRGTGRRLFVPGHYEIANGGVDTLPSLDLAYRLILKHAQDGDHVLYEGKNMSDGTTNIVHLKVTHEMDVRAILVSYPLEDCVAAVRARGHSIREETIERLYRKSFRDQEILERCGVRCETLPRDLALERTREWLR